LIPTIRSRLVAIRVPPLGAEALDGVLAEPAMRDALTAAGVPARADERRRLAAGAPGSLLGRAEWADAMNRAQRMLDAAAQRDRKAQMRVALSQGVAKARGAFTTSLDALSTLLHERARSAIQRGNTDAARAASRALDFVEHAKERA